MKINGNLLIFSTENEERIDVRKLKKKKLQIILNKKNELPKFEINRQEYIKSSAENEIEKLFEISNFYIEQLYTWGDPSYYTLNEEITITYLVIINKKQINNIPNDLKFYDLCIKNNENSSTQDVIVNNTNIAFSFLDKEFTLSELQQVYEIILDKKLVSANFRKKIEPMVKRTEIIVKESAYRPSNKYIFNEDYLKNWV